MGNLRQECYQMNPTHVELLERVFFEQVGHTDVFGILGQGYITKSEHCWIDLWREDGVVITAINGVHDYGDEVIFSCTLELHYKDKYIGDVLINSGKYSYQNRYDRTTTEEYLTWFTFESPDETSPVFGDYLKELINIAENNKGRNYITKVDKSKGKLRITLENKKVIPEVESSFNKIETLIIEHYFSNNY